MDFCEPEPEEEGDTEVYSHSIGDIRGSQDNSHTG